MPFGVPLACGADCGEQKLQPGGSRAAMRASRGGAAVLLRRCSFSDAHRALEIVTYRLRCFREASSGDLSLSANEGFGVTGLVVV